MSLSARLDDIRDAHQDDGTTALLHALFDALWEHRIETRPELATYLGEPGPTHRWTDQSLEAIDHRKDDAAAALAALEAIAPDELDEVDRTSLRLAVEEQRQIVQMGRFPEELLAMTTMYGIHIDVPQVLSIMPTQTIGDLEDIVARLSGVPVLVDQVIGLLEEGVDKGVTVPQVVARQLPEGVASLAGGDIGTSPLLAAFADRPETVDPDDFDSIREEALDAAQSAQSALRRLAQHLEATYASACRESTAFSELPDGDDWYAALVRQETTTSMTPQEIHDIGLDEVARIRNEMDDVIASTDFVSDTTTPTARFAAFVEFLRTDDRFYFTTADDLLSYYRDCAKRADAEVPRLFGLLPRLPYGVKAIPDHEAPTAAAAFYLPGSIELGRAGWFCANTYDLRARPRYEMEATCLHEGVPGHHLQIAIAAELEGLPKFRTKSWNYTAYVEGWGLYAESLGREMGFYQDPYNRFGQLASELWRAVRLVVDTGMHALGWSRQRAIDYCAETSPAAMHEIVTEVDRYLSIPGQALSYKVGELTISRLRREATVAMGEAFDLRRFHDLVLGAGPLPLGVLEERVTAWVGTSAPAVG